MDRAQIHLRQENPHEQEFPESRFVIDFAVDAL
jgi:hypothetical protein